MATRKASDSNILGKKYNDASAGGTKKQFSKRPDLIITSFELQFKNEPPAVQTLLDSVNL